MTDRRQFLQNAGNLPAAMLVTAAGASEVGAATATNVDIKDSKAQLPPPKIAGALAEQEKNPPSADTLGAASRENLLDSKYQMNWRDAKRSLAKALAVKLPATDPIANWLTVFSDSFDTISAAVVTKASSSINRPGSTTELCYEPQLFEGCLRGASTLLDRCLTYRREMGEFEVSGVKAALDYLTFVHVNPIQRSLMKLANDSDVAGIQQDYQDKAQMSYASSGQEQQIAQGHAFESGGAATAASVTALKENLKAKFARRQFDLTIEAQLAQFTRYVTPGSASNMAERYLRLRALLEEDLADAYRKLYCAAIGIAAVLGVTSVNLASSGAPVNTAIPLFAGANATSALNTWIQQFVPNPKGQRAPDVVDALVLWTRAVLRELDRRDQYESDVTISIPLSVPCGSRTTPILPSTVVQAAIKATKGKAAQLPFALAADALPFAATLAALRVIGIGLSLVHSIDDAVPLEYTNDFPPGTTPPNPAATHGQQVPVARNYMEPKWARFNAVVQTPDQNVQPVGTYKRPPVLLANVRLEGGTSGDLEPSPTLDPCSHNISPFGSWTVALDLKDVVWYPNDGGPQPIANFINGLILHLRLRGQATAT
jgi:hypothetical protein